MPEKSADGEFLDQPAVQHSRQAVIASATTYARYKKQYDRPRTPNAPWTRLGAVQSYEPVESGLRLHCDHGQSELTWLADDCLRVRIRPADHPVQELTSYAIDKHDWQAVAHEVSEEADTIITASSSTQCRIDRSSARLTLMSADGQTLYHERDGVSWREDETVSLSTQLQPDEAIYGTGERAHDLNLRGRRVTLWNWDPAGYQRGDDPIDYSIPFLIGLHDGGMYGLFWDNSSRGWLDMGAERSDELVFQNETGAIVYYLFSGQSLKAILNRYTELTGRMQMPPRWAIGYHQSRYSYYLESDVMNIAHELRARQIPCDAIYLDIHYMDGKRIFTWDRDNFPDIRGMIDKLHAMNFKVVTIFDPGILIDPDYHAYQSGIEQDIFLKFPDGERVMGVVWPGPCHFPDFSSPPGRQWWAEQVQQFLEATGVDGLWNDMNEPLVFLTDGPGDIPDCAQHDHDGQGSDHLSDHNTYGMLMGRASLMGLDQARPNKRQLNIIRAGYAGAQRYTSSWTADNYATWDDLRLSIAMTINMGLGGVAFTGPDVGGFVDDTSPELLARWTQAACLMPLFRNHSDVESQRQEPWLFGEEIERICREAIGLRYQLMPYLYTAFANSHFYGWPILNPLFSAEPDNPDLRAVDDCYLLGDQVLVAPVLNAHTLRRSVYLPAGDWYDYHSHRRLSGGRMISVEAPLDRLPLFIKAGTALLTMPGTQHADDAVIDVPQLRVYAGHGETQVYEDAGDGMDYQNGQHRWTTFTVTSDDDGLCISRHTEGAYQPDYTELRISITGLRHKPAACTVDGEAVELCLVDGLLLLRAGDFAEICVAY